MKVGGKRIERKAKILGFSWRESERKM